jgi:midasin
MPILLTSPPSSGKSLLISHLANELHSGATNHVVNIYLADTSLDARSLLGSYVSSPTNTGTFEWKEGVLIKAMREGKWVVLKDIERGSNEVLGVLKPLVESLGPGGWIGQRAFLTVPNRGTVTAADSFRIFATRSLLPSKSGEFATPTFFGAHKFSEIHMASPSSDELKAIISSRFPRLAGAYAGGIMRMWKDVCAIGISASTREIGLRDLEKFCARVQQILPATVNYMETDQETDLSHLIANPSLREEAYLEARDIFFGAGSITAAARAHTASVANTIAQHIGIERDRQEMLLERWSPQFDIMKDVNGKVTAVQAGRTRIPAAAASNERRFQASSRPFALHRPALCLLFRISTAISMVEPVLLTGETGTGKTSAITYLASILRRPLISLNMSHQTESADLIGGFKPIDARISASELQDIFIGLFGRTFSRKKNEKFETEARKAVHECKWKRAVGLWRESVRMAKERIQARQQAYVASFFSRLAGLTSESTAKSMTQRPLVNDKKLVLLQA